MPNLDNPYFREHPLKRFIYIDNAINLLRGIYNISKTNEEILNDATKDSYEINPSVLETLEDLKDGSPLSYSFKLAEMDGCEEVLSKVICSTLSNIDESSTDNLMEIEKGIDIIEKYLCLNLPSYTAMIIHNADKLDIKDTLADRLVISNKIVLTGVTMLERLIREIHGEDMPYTNILKTISLILKDMNINELDESRVVRDGDIMSETRSTNRMDITTRNKISRAVTKSKRRKQVKPSTIQKMLTSREKGKRANIYKGE